MLMHASYTGWLFVLYPATSFEQGLIWQTALAFAMWLIVAVAFAGLVRREPRPAVPLPPIVKDGTRIKGDQGRR